MSTIRPGITFRHVIADSNSLWEVVRKAGKDVWLAVVTPEQTTNGERTFTDEWAGTEQVFTTAQIEQKLRAAAATTNARDRADAWWDERTDGEIVHYANRSDQFVRGRIVTIDGDKQMMPVALVGAWQAFELPRRSEIGDVVPGYYATLIAKGEPWRPHPSCMFESTLSGMDPRTLPEIDLTLPEPTEQEQERYAAARVVAQIGKVSNDYTLTPFERLDRIKTLLAG